MTINVFRDRAQYGTLIFLRSTFNAARSIVFEKKKYNMYSYGRIRAKVGKFYAIFNRKKCTYDLRKFKRRTTKCAYEFSMKTFRSASERPLQRGACAARKERGR